MSWYMAARCWVVSIAAAAMIVVAAAVFGSATLELPDLFSGVVIALPVSVLLPAVPAAMVLWNMGRGEPAHEAAAVRRPAEFDLAAVAALLLAQVVTAALLAPWFSFADSLAVVRNTAGYVALTLVLSRLIGPVVANVVMVMFPIICVRFGTIYAAGAPASAWWAWPLDTHSSLVALTQVLTLCVAAAAITRAAWLPRRRGVPAGT
ncbi:hypothetical protein [Phytoactinopolyspora halotolerans]|uniref:Uncharacterized protein n=1 Tax=Phytoactinopolyspora halotolerans TaxID=1981512 RepID=A0A6L9SDV4_9ACTN|nr:hypothetical protein [Phytoactinopolyspora halotolerans]NEE03446.1 hypothetical protein [Phytoactinopolyspora halotolerans]